MNFYVYMQSKINHPKWWNISIKEIFLKYSYGPVSFAI